jgi:general secretion pathway protein K
MVLWLLVLLTVIAASHARNVRVETRLAHNQMAQATARALAEAGVNHAILELLVRGDMPRRPLDGSVNRIEIDGHAVGFSIRNANGLVDLNAAPAGLIDSLLAAAGVEETQRNNLTDAILDWRDGDDLRHLHGAEDDDYRHAGFNWGVRDGPFTSVDELRYVMGMTGELYERLLPSLTVYSGYAGVRLEFASPWLAAALTHDDGTGPPAPVPPSPGTAATGTDGVYHIIAWAGENAGTLASVEAVVRITAAGKTPYTVLSWRQPAQPFRPLPG